MKIIVILSLLFLSACADVECNHARDQLEILDECMQSEHCQFNADDLRRYRSYERAVNRYCKGNNYAEE